MYILKFIAGSLLYFGHTSLLRNWDIELIKRESKSIGGNILQNNKNVYLPKSNPIWNFTYPPFENFLIKDKKLVDIIINTFLELFPQYKEWLIRTQRQYAFHKCNIFIMDTKSFYEYSEWLFTYLFEIEKRISWIDTSKELIHERFMWALAEFMIDFWLNCVKWTKTTQSVNLISFNI